MSVGLFQVFRKNILCRSDLNHFHAVAQQKCKGITRKKWSALRAVLQAGLQQPPLYEEKTVIL